jgi:pilus assembly protein CpaD
MIAVATVTLVGCDSMRELDRPGFKPIEAQLLHPISADIQRVSLDVHVIRGDAGFSGAEHFEVIKFVRHYRRDGRGPLDIAVPNRGSGPPSRTLAKLGDAIKSAGIDRQRVRIHDRHDGRAIVTMSFDRLVAVAPVACRDWSDDVARRPETGPYNNFGCATQRNLANMIADPTDIVVPALEAPRGSDRRAATFKDYSQTNQKLDTSAGAKK